MASPGGSGSGKHADQVEEVGMLCAVVGEALSDSEFLEAARTIGKSLGLGLSIACPPIAPLLISTSYLAENAARVLRCKASIATLQTHVQSVTPHLQVVERSSRLMSICGQPVSLIADSLYRLRSLVDRFSERWFIVKMYNARSTEREVNEISDNIKWAFLKLNSIISLMADKELELKSKKDQKQDGALRYHEGAIKKLQKEVLDLKMHRDMAEAWEADARDGAKDSSDAFVEFLSEKREEEYSKRGKSAGGSEAMRTWQLAKTGQFAKLEEVLLRPGGGSAAEHGHCFGQLHQAVFWDDAFGVAMLMDRKADFNQGTFADETKFGIRQGSTPLHCAMHFGFEAGVQLLLVAGANPELKDADGKRPDELQTTRGCRETWKRRDQLKQCAAQMRDLCTKGQVEEAEAVRERAGLLPDIRLGRTFHFIHWTAVHGCDAVYAKLVMNGAHPRLRSGPGGPGVEANCSNALPSDLAALNKHDGLAAIMKTFEMQVLQDGVHSKGTAAATCKLGKPDLFDGIRIRPVKSVQWQVELRPDWWANFPDDLAKRIRALPAGTKVLEYKVHDKEYRLDFETKEQRNLKTGTVRKVRCVESP